MFSMPIAAINKRLTDAFARMHNMPEDMKKDETQILLDTTWDEIMGKAETYVQGPHIIERGGYFSTLSLGNWMTLCNAADVEIVPSRLAAVVNPVFLFSVAMNGLHEDQMEEMSEFLGGFQDIEEDEIVRFDTGAGTPLKTELTLGRADGSCPAYRGYNTRGTTVFPDFDDQRIINLMMECTDAQAPVWIRKWVEPAMMEGNATAGYRSAVLPGESTLPEGETITGGWGNLFPCEWRVFVLNGEVTAVGNYYPQVSRGLTPEDETRALAMARAAKEAAQRLIAKMRDLHAIPHSPKYEMRPGFDADAIHFSLDFLEVEDDTAPEGRRLVMIEGGPAHLRNPNWGAHPVAFGTAKAPEGVALSTSDIRPLSVLDL